MLLTRYPEFGSDLRKRIRSHLERQAGQTKEGSSRSELEACLKHIDNGEKLPRSLELKALEELTGQLVVILDSAARVINEKGDLAMKDSEKGETLFVQHRADGTFSILRPEHDAGQTMRQLLQGYRRLSTGTASSTTESTSDDADDNDLRGFLTKKAHYNAWSMTRSYKRIARLSRLICEERPLKKKVYNLLKRLAATDERANSDDWHNVAEKFEAFVTSCAEQEAKKPFIELEKKLCQFFKEESPEGKLKEERRLKEEAQANERKAQANERKAQEEIAQLREQVRRLSGHTAVDQSPASAISNFGVYAHSTLSASSGSAQNQVSQSSSEIVSESDHEKGPGPKNSR